MLFLKSILRNSKSSAIGLALIATCIASVVNDYALLQSVEWWGAMLAGVGFIVAKDGDKTGLPG